MALKTPPSTIYWTALAQYGIRRRDEDDGWLRKGRAANVEAEELAERRRLPWKWIGGVAVAFIVGVGIGVAGEPEPEVVSETVTETVTEEVEVEPDDIGERRRA